jgi:hypothetical protein
MKLQHPIYKMWIIADAPYCSLNYCQITGVLKYYMGSTNRMTAHLTHLVTAEEKQMNSILFFCRTHISCFLATSSQLLSGKISIPGFPPISLSDLKYKAIYTWHETSSMCEITMSHLWN